MTYVLVYSKELEVLLLQKYIVAVFLIFYVSSAREKIEISNRLLEKQAMKDRNHLLHCITRFRGFDPSFSFVYIKMKKLCILMKKKLIDNSLKLNDH